MFRLTREVRFAVNRNMTSGQSDRPMNNYAGYPSLAGFGTFLTLQSPSAGELDPASNYLVNIKQIDAVFREHDSIYYRRDCSAPSAITPEQARGRCIRSSQERVGWFGAAIS